MNKVNQLISKYRKWIILGFILVIIMSGAAVYQAARSRSEAARAAVIAADEKRFEEDLRLANIYRSQKNDSAAISTLEGYLKDGLNEAHKSFIYITIGTIYEGSKDYKSALAAYRKAEARDSMPKRSITIGIARSSYALGDKATALKYYKMSRDILKKKDKEKFSIDIEVLDKKIKKIESEL